MIVEGSVRRETGFRTRPRLRENLMHVTPISLIFLLTVLRNDESHQ